MMVFLPHPEPLAPDDPLVRAKWAGTQLIRRLHEASLPYQILSGPNATRASLEAALPQPGIAAFAHGDRWALYAHHQPAIDAENVARFQHGWLYIFACNTGLELTQTAIDAGVPFCCGYRMQLHLDWHPDEIPPEILVDFAGLCSEVPFQLASGQRNPVVIRAEIDALADQLLLWLGENMGTIENGFALLSFANQLRSTLVIKCGRALTPSDPRAT